MKKIPNLFLRDWNGDKSRVLPVFNPEADVAWVVAGEGTPTVKWDGSACLVRDGKLFVRFDNKKAKPIENFEPCQDRDPVTGHWPGWIPAHGPPSHVMAHAWHKTAFDNSTEVAVANGAAALEDGTYEACGPQFQGNPYEFPRNILIRHGADVLKPMSWKTKPLAPWTGAAEAHDLLRVFLETTWWQHPEQPRARLIEGIVWHHPDGRMVKVLASDLGLAWKAKNREEKR